MYCYIGEGFYEGFIIFGVVFVFIAEEVHYFGSFRRVIGLDFDASLGIFEGAYWCDIFWGFFCDLVEAVGVFIDVGWFIWVIEEGSEYLFKGWLFCFCEEFEEESIEEVHLI